MIILFFFNYNYLAYCPCPPRIIINYTTTLKSLPVEKSKPLTTRKPPLLILPELKPLPKLENNYFNNNLDNYVAPKTGRRLYFARNFIIKHPIRIKHIKY